MAKMDWDRVRREDRVKTSGCQTVDRNGERLGRVIPLSRQNQYDGSCPACGKKVRAGQGWLKNRKPYHAQCFTTLWATRATTLNHTPEDQNDG